MASFAGGGALEHRAGPRLDLAMATALSDCVGFGYVITWAIAAVILAVSAVLIRRSKAGLDCLDRAAISILLMTAVGMATSPAAQLPMRLFTLWVLAVSVLLIRRSAR